MRINVRAFLFLFLIPVFIFAGITGKIAGRVIDASTGEPLPMVNVIVVGSEMGAATGMDGRYYIINVPVGTYTLEASMVGYQTVRISNVKVVQDMTTHINFKLSPEAIKTKVVKVTAKRSMVQKDVTASMSRISKRDIERRAVSDFTDIVAQQAGTVETKGRASSGLHIRGGRSNEVMYVVDGVNVNDPVYGTSGIQLDNAAIAEMLVVSGGFNAEYGNAMSGIVNIVTKEGGKKLSGSIYYDTDEPMRLGEVLYRNFIDTTYEHLYGFGHDNISLTLGGPLFTRMLTFFVSGNILEHFDRLPHAESHRKSGTGKLAFKPFRGFKLTVSANYSQSWWISYDHYRSLGTWWQDWPMSIRDNYQLNMQIRHQILHSTFYSVNVGTFSTHFHRAGMRGKDYKDWKEFGRFILTWPGVARDSSWWDQENRTWSVPQEVLDRYHLDTLHQDSAAWFWFYEYMADNGNGYGEMTDEGWKWTGKDKLTKLKHQRDALNARYYDVNEWVLDEQNKRLIYHEFDLEKYLSDVDKYKRGELEKDSIESSGDMYYIRYNSDRFRRFGYNFYPIWHDRQTTKYFVSFSITSQVNKFNQMKTGIDINYHDLTLKNVAFINENPYSDSYHKTPILAAGFIQDKIEYEDLTLNPGIRIDYLDPRSDFYLRLDSLEAGMAPASPKIQISPRFGISFSVSEKSVMYASYGHFFQPVEFAEMYQNLQADVTTGYPLIGNPDLPPKKTIAYEIGYRQAITEDIATEIVAYYKDVTNLLGTRNVNTLYRTPEGKYALATYTVYKLQDYAVIKGADFSITKRFSPFLSGNITYSYLDAKGTGSYGTEFYFVYRTSGVPLPKKEYPLDFDITHTVKGNVNFYLPEGMPVKILSNINTNVTFSIASGAPYTPTDSKGRRLTVGSKRMPPSFNMDMRVEKAMKIGFLNLSLYTDIRNVFNVRNWNTVYSNTGLPNDNGGAPKPDPSAYSSYAYYGFDSWYDYWKADYDNWKRKMDNPYVFSDPRTIRVGLKVRF